MFSLIRPAIYRVPLVAIVPQRSTLRVTLRSVRSYKRRYVKVLDDDGNDYFQERILPRVTPAEGEISPKLWKQMNPKRRLDEIYDEGYLEDDDFSKPTMNPRNKQEISGKFIPAEREISKKFGKQMNRKPKSDEFYDDNLDDVFDRQIMNQNVGKGSLPQNKQRITGDRFTQNPMKQMKKEDKAKEIKEKKQQKTNTNESNRGKEVVPSKLSPAKYSNISKPRLLGIPSYERLGEDNREFVYV